MKKKLTFKREFSAGTVVFKKSPLKFLLGKHSGYHKWVLPKGLIEKEEKGYQAAIRETEEEMGIKARLVSEKPIYKEEYFYIADFKKPLSPETIQFENDKKQDQSTRRVAKYQEKGGGKTRVFKTVSFYLAEYESGDPKNHGWEMSEAGWFTYEEALEKMAFDGEKEVLRKALYHMSYNKEYGPD